MINYGAQQVQALTKCREERNKCKAVLRAVFYAVVPCLVFKLTLNFAV
jgi:hypothetical protein